MACKYKLKGTDQWFKSKEALATHLNKTPTLIEALKGAPNLNERTPTGNIVVNGEVQPIVTEGEQQGVQSAVNVEAGQGEAALKDVESTAKALDVDLASIIKARLRDEGVSQEERNRLTGTRDKPIITSATKADYDALLKSYKDSKQKQLADFDEGGKEEGKFIPEKGLFISSDISFWDNKIKALESLLSKEQTSTNNSTGFDDIDNANTAKDLAKLYREEQHNPTAIDIIDLTIADHISGDINRDSYSRFGDPNKVGSSMAKTYFAKAGEKGRAIDQIALEASNTLGREITPDDVVSFMEKYPNGMNAQGQRDNARLRAIGDKYKALTGKNLNKTAAQSILEKENTGQQSKLARAEEMAQKFYDEYGNDKDAFLASLDDEGLWTIFPFGYTKEEFNQLKQFVKSQQNGNTSTTGEEISSTNEIGEDGGRGNGESGAGSGRDKSKAEPSKAGLKQKAASFRERAAALKNAQPKENDGNVSPATTTKEEIAERKSKTKKLKYEYDSAQAEYAKKKEAFDKNAQQNQAQMFGATPQDEMLFKNNLKEQKELLDKAKAKADKTKAEYLESKKVLDDMLEGQAAITFADNLRDKAAELRASSGQGLSVLPNALATAYEVFADILDAASDIKEAIRQWKETKEYKALSEQDVKIANKSIVDEFGDVNLQNETAERRPEQGGNGRGRIEGRRIAPLEGAPSVQGINGPDAQLVAVAEQYAQENGIPLTRQAEYVEVDTDRATRISDAYAQMKHDPQNRRVKEAYQNLIKQTIAQYEALVKAGYKFWFLDTNIPSNIKYVESPYNAIRDLRQNREMGVFPTTDGFGSSELDVSGNPLMEETQFMWPVGGPNGQLKPVLANDLFRAVHDAFGHGLEGAGFRARGEENAWQAHVRLFTGSAIGAITTETRGQNSWLNFGPHGENNRTAKTEDTIFADQKTGLMPEWTWTEGRAGDMMNEQQSSEIFAQVDDAINKTGVEATTARRALKEKFGADNYQKAIKITREFDKITDRLDAEGKITKKCP